MKKLFLGLLVAGVALGASAFTNVEQFSKAFAKTYYQQPDGSYSIVAPPGTTCGQQNANPCILNYSNTPTVDSFPSYSARPAGQFSTTGLGYIQ